MCLRLPLLLYTWIIPAVVLPTSALLLSIPTLAATSTGVPTQILVNKRVAHEALTWWDLDRVDIRRFIPVSERLFPRFEPVTPGHKVATLWLYQSSPSNTNTNHYEFQLPRTITVW